MLWMYLSWVLGTNVFIPEEYSQGKVEIEFHKADVGSFDVIELESVHYQTFELICHPNRAFDEKYSFLRFKNFFGLDGGHFKIPHKKCWKVKKHVEKIFRGVDAYHPIKIQVDRKKQVVSRIDIPYIDPLLQHVPLEKLKEIQYGRERLSIWN